MTKLAANLSLMFTELDFLDRFGAAAKAGFHGVEFLFPYAFPIEEIKQRLHDHDLQLVLFNLSPGNWEAGERGLTALKGRESEFKPALETALTYAQALGCRQLHAMAGLVGHGADRARYVENLHFACDQARSNDVTILIEPINTVDMPGYFLTTTEQAAEIIAEVGAPNLGLQFDLYHRQKMQGGVGAAIDTFQGVTRHYQCADPADRGEPSLAVVDYKALFAAIAATGFDGWIGCEYRPRGDTLAGLDWVDSCGLSLSG
jgi:2-dehydrotetronate isomerase